MTTLLPNKLPLSAAPRRSFAVGRARWPLWTAVPVWLLVAGSVAHWGARLLQANQPAAAPPPAAAAPGVDARAMALALGAEAPGAVATPDGVPEAPGHALLGLVADAQGQGVALLQVPGGPVRPWRVGQRLPDGWRLDALGGDHAVLSGPGSAPAVTLRLPAAH